MTPVKFSLHAKCLLSPSKIVLRFRNRPNWGWRRPLWALKNRKPNHAGTLPELKFSFKITPSLPKMELLPLKVSVFQIFGSPSRDPQILKPTPGIDSASKSRGYISFFQHSQTNPSCIWHDFLPKFEISTHLYFPLYKSDFRIWFSIKFWSISKKNSSKTHNFSRFCSTFPVWWRAR